MKDSDEITEPHIKKSGPEPVGSPYNGENCRVPSCHGYSITEIREGDLVLSIIGVTNYRVPDIFDTEVVPENVKESGSNPKDIET